MGISIDVTANAQGFVSAAGQAAASLGDISDALDFIAKNADMPQASLEALLTKTQAQAQAAGDALSAGYNKGTLAVRGLGDALTQADAELQRTQSQLDGMRGTPAVLDDSFSKMGQSARTAGDELGKTGETAQESGEKIEEGGKLGEAAMMNVGFSAMQAGSLFTDGISGMAEQVGTFAAFMGPSLAGVEGALAGLAWPVTIAGVAVAALAGLMSTAGASADDTTKAVQDFVNATLKVSEGANSFDTGLREWTKDATDFGGVALNQLSKDASTTGSNFDVLARSIIDKNVPAMQKLKTGYQDNVEALEANNAKIQEAAQKAGQSQVITDKQTASNDKLISSYKEQEKALDNQIAAQKGYEAAIKSAAEAQGMTVAQYTAYEAAVQQATTDQKNFSATVAQGAQAASQSTSDWAASQKVNFSQMQTNQQEFLDAYAKFPATISQLTSEGLTDMGKQYAESVMSPQQMEQLLTVPPAQRSAIIAQWNSLGQETTKGLNDGINASGLSTVTIKTKADTSGAESDIAKVGKSSPTTTVKTKADTSTAESEINSTASKKRTATVNVDADTKTAQSDLDKVTSQKRTATITARVDTSDAEAALNRLTAPRSVTVTVNQKAGTSVP